MEILDRNDYYAFGMNLYEQNSVYAAGTPLNNKYNNKELQESGFYDYGWRQYMPDLGRWFGMDQLSETYSSTSPYAYVMNNPASFFDPDGRSTEMPDWLKTMWAMTPTGTNTSWSNAGTGSGFMNTGFSGSMSGNCTGFYSPIGSTVGYSGTGTYAFGNSGGLGGNSGGYSGGSEGYINLSTVYVSGNSSGWGKQAQAQFNAFMDVINENTDAFEQFGKWNTGLGFAFTGIEKMPGSFRFTNGAYNGSSWSPKYYGSGWAGGSRARISTYNIGKIGKGLGILGYLFGIGVDGYAASQNKTSWTKFGLNATIGAYGFTSVGAFPAAIYGGIDNFIPVVG